MKSVPPRGSGWSADCRFAIADCQLMLETERQSEIGNRHLAILRPVRYRVTVPTKTEAMPDNDQPRDLDQEQARLAYTIIESLLEHTRVVSDLIALMAQTLDEDTTKALTQTPVWTAYLDSRRAMERTRADVEKFAEIMKDLDRVEGQSPMSNVQTPTSEEPE